MMKVRPRRGLVLLKWVETKVSQYIHMIDGREGSRAMSAKEGTEDLRARLAGKKAGNIGVVIAIDPRDAEEHELTPGDVVIYDQESAHIGMSKSDSHRIARAMGAEDWNTQYFFVDVASVGSALPDGIPAPGRVA